MTPNYAIFRTDKLKTHADVVNVLKEQHREASYDSKRADPSKRDLNDFSSDYAEALRQYDELLPKKIRKNAVVGLNFLVSTSEEFENAEEEKEYYKQARDYIECNFGKIVGWAIHRDETSTHMQVVTIPLKDGKLNARAMLGGSKQRMSEIQTEFFNLVGQNFGLERGMEHSQAVHKTVEEYHREREKELNEREAELEKRELEAESIINSVASAQALQEEVQEEKKTWETSKTESEKYAEEVSKEAPLAILGKVEQYEDLGSPEKLEKKYPLEKTGKLTKENPYQYADRMVKHVWNYFSTQIYAPLKKRCEKLLKTVKDLKLDNELKNKRIEALERENSRLSNEVDKVVDERLKSRSNALIESGRAEYKAKYDDLYGLVYSDNVTFDSEKGVKCTAKNGLLKYAKKCTDELAKFKTMTPKKFREWYDNEHDQGISMSD